MSKTSNTPSVPVVGEPEPDYSGFGTRQEMRKEIVRLRAENKRLLILSLDYALSVAESDPFYMEAFRPYFKRLNEALK